MADGKLERLKFPGYIEQRVEDWVVQVLVAAKMMVHRWERRPEEKKRLPTHEVMREKMLHCRTCT